MPEVPDASTDAVAQPVRNQSILAFYAKGMRLVRWMGREPQADHCRRRQMAMAKSFATSGAFTGAGSAMGIRRQRESRYAEKHSAGLPRRRTSGFTRLETESLAVNFAAQQARTGESRSWFTRCHHGKPTEPAGGPCNRTHLNELASAPQAHHEHAQWHLQTGTGPYRETRRPPVAPIAELRQRMQP